MSRCRPTCTAEFNTDGNVVGTLTNTIEKDRTRSCVDGTVARLPQANAVGIDSSSFTTNSCTRSTFAVNSHISATGGNGDLVE